MTGRDWIEADFPLHGGWERPGAVASALVFAHDAHGRVLMQLRDERTGLAHSGRWGPFGGGVEAGETLSEAALREMTEETGLRLAAEALRPLGRALSNTALRTRLYAFSTPLPAGVETIRLGEGAGFALLTLGQLRRFPLARPVRAMAIKLAEGLADGAAG